MLKTVRDQSMVDSDLIYVLATPVPMIISIIVFDEISRDVLVERITLLRERNDCERSSLVSGRGCPTLSGHDLLGQLTSMHSKVKAETLHAEQTRASHTKIT